MYINKTNQKLKRQKRTRAKLKGTAKRPRLSVHKSSKYVYAQLIDDEKRKTIAGASEKHFSKSPKTTKTEGAKRLGYLIAKIAKEKKISSVIFDRGGSSYHGRVKALAEGAREGGLKF